MALDTVAEGLDGPVVVAGDFNSVSSARIGRQVQRDLGLRPAPGFPGTWPGDLPSAFGITIDQVYASPDLAFVSRRLGRPTGSDHRPVVTEITRAKD
jgi:endonuclease/exonuclease/phosphatase (EEP) superfamily protein YafD